MNYRRYQNRRGITLLFVVSMIVLFLLMGTTFVVVSNDYLTASKKRIRKDIKVIDGTAFVERAFYEIVRGPDLDNTTSPLRGHSILADMYGYGFKGIVDGIPVVADVPGTRYFASPVSSNGQLISVELRSETGVTDYVTNIRTGVEQPLDASNNAEGKPGQYNGMIMTFVSGPASGISGRIVDYQIDDDGSGNVTNRRFIIAPNWSDSGSVSLAGLADSEVVVNNRAFGGFGAGLFTDPGSESAPALTAAALQPNRVGETRSQLTNTTNGYLGDNAGPNESYDAPDFQNMFLSGYDSASTPVFFGSFWRAGLTDNGEFEAFTGNGLEVDTNNDGQNDAIWMDTGMPVQTNGNGFYYKPLVAYYVADLDGRLNLNTVGNLSDMLNNVQINDMGTPGDRSDDTVIYNPPAYAGQGYGPAEISPARFLGLGQRYTDNGNVVGNPNMDYEKILMGDFASGTPGRYGLGADGIAGTRVSTTPLIAGDEVPGAAGRDDWSTQKLFGLPTGVNTVGGLYASSPLDIRGRFAVGTFPTSVFPDLNNFATFNNSLPATDFSVAVAANDSLTNSPYESNFAPSPGNRWEVGDDDLPFHASELERMLRANDVDSNLLPTRLTQLAPSVFGDLNKRNSVTTDSYEVPVLPFYGLNDSGRARPLVDILRDKIKNDPTPGNPYFGREDFEIDQYVREILPPEIMVGMKMDVNRLFGNGYDDNSDFVKDDYDETGIQLNVDQTGMPAFDIDNNFVAGGNDAFARVKFARHLYILMLLATEDNVANGTLPVEDYRRAIAQWAINVVDFRDQDSINTPFEYDFNPWNGWDARADGVIDPGETATFTGDTGDRRIVWGAERPELLITETFAHHDRANEDLATDNGDNDDTASGNDDDFDSRLVPRSSAFIELYHPWTQSLSSQILPAELARTPAAPTGVDLQALSPNDEPVWRLALKRDPDPAANFVRAIYFADYTANPWSVTDIAGDQFYTTLNVPVIEPGVFAVVGPSGTQSGAPGGEYPTTIGRRQAAVEGDASTLQLADTRSITLVPSANPNNDQILRTEWDGAMMSQSASKGIAVVIDGPRSLSISDPDGGYPNDPLNPRIDVVDGEAYTVPYDTPLDESQQPNANDKLALWNNGTTDAFRTVFLQRLANPLQPWNADSNPYITIDIAAIDLTAFNGVQNQPGNDPIPNERALGVTDGVTDLASTERGETQLANTRMLFAREYGEAAAEGVQIAGDQHNLSFELLESFGRTNDAYLNNGPMNYYAWLTWNNRPFVSQYELANVPFVSQEDLTTAFSLHDTTPFAPGTIFDGDKAMPVLPTSVLASSFGHLLNFHGHDETANNPTRANFYRLFDYTEVPSRYVGTEMWLNSADFTNYPHNFISHYRYPGKLNLNTIHNEDVYNALMGDYISELNFTAFNASRWNGSFFRPYRNSGEGNFVPPGVNVEENVDCGLFRRANPGDADSIFDFTNTTNYQNADRSAYFRNAMRQRLGNLVTTRSSVFAIWITVGYFECEISGALKTDAAGNGIEVGVETGEVKRNRGFYIFDRSIPMAFEPGKNHNVERGILVQSMIE